MQDSTSDSTKFWNDDKKDGRGKSAWWAPSLVAASVLYPGKVFAASDDEESPAPGEPGPSAQSSSDQEVWWWW